MTDKFDQIKLDMNHALAGSYERNRMCLEDFRFAMVEGAMWEGSIGKQFKNKPKPVINKIFLAINRILGQKQRLEMNANIVSNSEDATEEGADVLQSRWRNDFQSGDGVEAINNADKEAFFSGFGAHKLVATYEDEENPDQEKQNLTIEPIYSAASSVVFGPSLKRDKSDCKQAWELIRTNRREVEEEFGVKVSSVNGQMDFFDWDTDTTKDLYLAHYYEVVNKTITEHIFSDGMLSYSVFSGDGIKDENGNKVSQEDLAKLKNDYDNEDDENTSYETIRRKKKHVMYSLMAGDQFLIKPRKTPFKRIPIIPQYGYHCVINGIEYYCGEVRKRKDPQMFTNTFYSSLMEVMSAPQVSKPEYLPEQIARHAEQRRRADIDNVPFLLSDPVRDAEGNIQQAGPIGYSKPPELGSGLAAAGQAMDTALSEMSGAGASTLPSNVAADAVRQVNERQDDAFQPLMQGSIMAIKALCEVWIDAAQSLYFTNSRSIRVVSTDGTYTQLQTLDYGMDDNENFGPYKNSAKGKYTVQVKADESYKSKKDAERQTALDMLQVTDPNSPTYQVLSNEAIMATTGEGGKLARKMARFSNMVIAMNMGIDPVPETDEERQFIEQKLQAASQQQEPDSMMVAAMAEDKKANAQLMEQENKRLELNMQAAKMQNDAQGKQSKQLSDNQFNYVKSQQEQEKIYNKKVDDTTKNAIKLAELEVKAGQQLDSEVNSNMQD